MAQSQLKKLSSTRNPIARLLKHFTPQRFRDKTKYNRKSNGEIWKRTLGKSDEA
jgi:hypothetical protein